MLPMALEGWLENHMVMARENHQQARSAVVGEVHMPEALARKYPNAPSEWRWQGLFASATLCPHPRTGKVARHHLHEAPMQRQFKNAVRKAAIPKPATSHCMRHSFATHLLQGGIDIRTFQNHLGHSSVVTTMIPLHALQRPGAGAPSPLDLAQTGFPVRPTGSYSAFLAW